MGSEYGGFLASEAWDRPNNISITGLEQFSAASGCLEAVELHASDGDDGCILGLPAVLPLMQGAEGADAERCSCTVRVQLLDGDELEGLLEELESELGDEEPEDLDIALMLDDMTERLQLCTELARQQVKEALEGGPDELQMQGQEVAVTCRQEGDLVVVEAQVTGRVGNCCVKLVDRCRARQV